jgi:predicted NAD-dependent protein-ADP-ribosyltransferase YbiA (DUF1768 family)
MSWTVPLLAGFQVTINGRFWVTPEGQVGETQQTAREEQDAADSRIGRNVPPVSSSALGRRLSKRKNVTGRTAGAGLCRER